MTDNEDDGDWTNGDDNDGDFTASDGDWTNGEDDEDNDGDFTTSDGDWTNGDDDGDWTEEDDNEIIPYIDEELDSEYEPVGFDDPSEIDFSSPVLDEVLATFNPLGSSN